MAVTIMTAASNRAAVLREPGVITVEDLPVPVPADDEVLVQVLSVGICGSDLHYHDDGRIGDFVVRDPLILGHEAAGVVASAPAGEDRLRPGTLVAIEPGFPCRSCAQCRAGRYNLCPAVRFLATPPVDGAFARYITVPAGFCHPVPASFGADRAALLEPLSVAVWACRKAWLELGDRVLITGAGPVGILTALAAIAAGAEPTITDISHARLNTALSVGIKRARHADEVSRESGFRALIECSGAPGAAANAIRSLAPAGRVVLVGMNPDDDLYLPLSVIQTRELSITGSFRYANTYPAAIALARNRNVPLDAFLAATKAFPLDKAREAIEQARDPRLLKVFIHPNEETTP